MTLFLRVMLLLAALPGFALALDLAPAEEPPPDFAARQYIDSRGCVFRRDASDRWQAQLSRDGAPICGYPPTRSMRGLNGKPRLSALDPDAGLSRARRLELALSQTVITDLRSGELASDPRPLEKLPDLGPEPASSEPVAALQAALAAAPAIRQEMAGSLQPNKRLCELLGHDGKAAKAAFGRDPSQGYCASLPEADLARLSFARPLGSIQADRKPAPAVAPAKTALTEPRGHGPAEPGRVTAAATPAIGQPKATSEPRPRDGRRAMPAGMIPVTARYVELGRFPDPARAARAIHQLGQLGYPALRGKGDDKPDKGPLILTGPFDGREAIVRALDAIRRAGFAGAIAR